MVAIAKRCAIIIATLSVVVLSAAVGRNSLGAAEQAARPNILFLFSDDQSPRTVGCYPQSWPWVRTPNMDRLAKSGIRFTHCYLGSWCMPSRVNLVTGNYPQEMSLIRVVEKE